MSTFYKKPDLEYTELKEAELNYNEVTDILAKSDPYQELMEKESKVLNAVNSIVKSYKDNEIVDTEFVNMRLSFIANRFFVVIQEIIKDLVDRKINIETFTKDDRVFYVGIFLIIISMVVYIF